MLRGQVQAAHRGAHHGPLRRNHLPGHRRRGRAPKDRPGDEHQAVRGQGDADDRDDDAHVDADDCNAGTHLYGDAACNAATHVGTDDDDGFG